MQQEIQIREGKTFTQTDAQRGELQCATGALLDTLPLLQRLIKRETSVSGNDRGLCGGHIVAWTLAIIRVASACRWFSSLMLRSQLSRNCRAPLTALSSSATTLNIKVRNLAWRGTAWRGVFIRGRKRREVAGHMSCYVVSCRVMSCGRSCSGTQQRSAPHDEKQYANSTFVHF